MTRKMKYEDVLAFYNMNGLELLDSEYVNNNKPMTAIDSEGYYIFISYASLKNGCKGHRFSKYNPNTIYNINKWLELNDKKINILSTEYPGNKKYVYLMCTNDNCNHIWGAILPNILSGKGCPKCANKNVTTYDFIKKSKLIHGSMYDYSFVNYINSTTKVKIICKKHGEFMQTPACHLAGNGCPTCSHEKTSKRLCMGRDGFIKRANKIHANFYDYSKVDYIDCNKRVIITCPIHGDFLQFPTNHIHSSTGCPYCKMSSSEKNIEEYLKLKNIEYIRQMTFNGLIGVGGRKLSYDFYVEEFNLLIESNGVQHEKPIEFFGGEDQFKKQQEHDDRKREFAKENGYNLLEIWYYDFNNIEEIINSFINTHFSVGVNIDNMSRSYDLRNSYS